MTFNLTHYFLRKTGHRSLIAHAREQLSLTMSWIKRTPSERSWTSECMGGYSFASSLVLSLDGKMSSSTKAVHESGSSPLAEGPLLSRIHFL